MRWIYKVTLIALYSEIIIISVMRFPRTSLWVAVLLRATDPGVWNMSARRGVSVSSCQGLVRLASPEERNI